MNLWKPWPLFTNPNKIMEGFEQLQGLVKKGDSNAFGVVCQIYKNHLPNRFASYINDTRRYLIDKNNYEDVARMGNILLSLERPMEAYLFLKEALSNKHYLSLPIEDVEYNYVTALCAAGLSLISSRFNPFNEAWLILKKYLHRSKEKEFNSLFIMFFVTVKQANQELLINEIGHYLVNGENIYNHTLTIYTNTFDGTQHLDRLLRQKKIVAISSEDLGNSKKDWQTATERALRCKIKRQEDFMLKTRGQIEDFALQELLTLLSDNQNIKNSLKALGSNDFSSIADENRSVFARHLVYDFSNRLFPHLNMDVTEYLTNRDAGLSSNSEKQAFLIQYVFPKVKDAQAQALLARVNSIVYNRLALCLMDNKALSDQFSSLWQQKLDHEKKLSLFAEILMRLPGETLFSNVRVSKINTDDKELLPIDLLISSLGNEKKREILASAIRQLVEGK